MLTCMCRKYNLGSLPSLASKTNCKEYCFPYTVNSLYVQGKKTKPPRSSCLILLNLYTKTEAQRFDNVYAVLASTLLVFIQQPFASFFRDLWCDDFQQACQGRPRFHWLQKAKL